jgi:hypothetical protein
MKRLLAFGCFALFLTGCSKDENTRANEKLMKSNRARLAKEQKQSRQKQVKAKTNPEQVFPRVEKAPATSEESGLGRTSGSGE